MKTRINTNINNLLLATYYSLLVFGLSGSAGLEAKKINPHQEQNHCFECHTKEEYAELKGSIIETCARCHEEIISGVLHPLEGMHNLTTTTVESLPLKEGKIVCITCHEPHGKTEHYRLLRKDPNDLCTSCHLK
jgi:predicted CXXCH cytochrome family protein